MTLFAHGGVDPSYFWIHQSRARPSRLHLNETIISPDWRRTEGWGALTLKEFRAELEKLQSLPAE